MTDLSPTPAVPRILTRDGASSIAYHALPGKNPGIVFLHGYRSDMYGTKAQALAEFCRQQGRSFLAYDAYGHGQSEGDLALGSIGRWTHDAVEVITALTGGPQILVGSSLGGWIGLLAALQLGRKVTAFVGIAAAPDFTEDLILAQATAEEKMHLREKGYLTLREGEEDWHIPRLLLEEARNHLLLRDTINLDCPVRLLHGQKDDSVPWQTALTLADCLRSDDVRIHLVKDGDHRLSRDQDLALLLDVLRPLL